MVELRIQECWELLLFVRILGWKPVEPLIWFLWLELFRRLELRGSPPETLVASLMAPPCLFHDAGGLAFLVKVDLAPLFRSFLH